MAGPLEKINEIIDTLNTSKDSDDVPELLAEMMAIANNADPDQLREDLGPAIQIALVPPVPGIGVPTPTFGLGTKVPGRGGGAAIDEEIVVKAKPKKDKPAQTVGDLIQEAIEPQIAMSKILDRYIRLVVREMVIEESLDE